MNEGIAALVAAGNYAETACRTMGITPNTFRAWLQQGTEDEAEGRETIHHAFLRAINEADAKAEAALVATARSKVETDRTGIAAFTFMDRRWRDRWGQHATVDVNEHKSVTITHVEVCLPPGSRPEAIDTTVTEVPCLPAVNDDNAKFTPVSGDES
jgi:transposase-like protein